MAPLSDTAKTTLWALGTVALLGVIALIIFLVVKYGDAPPGFTVPGAGAGSAVGATLAAAVPGTIGDMVHDGVVPPPPIQEPTVDGESLRIVPRDTLLKVEYWDDRWRFNQPDIGHVSFVVNKNSGLVVTIADAPGYPKGGYAFVIDQRGGKTTNLSDTTTSSTYLTRLPQMEAPASNSALVRNVELANVPRKIDIDYRHGIIELYVDGVLAIGYNDPFPNSNISYVGFGTMGIKSGEGLITNLVID